MATSDQTYRDLKKLHVIFACACVALLLATAWMLTEDYVRPYKAEQRRFRDVEAELARRAVLQSAPGPDQQAALLASEGRLASARALRTAVAAKAEVEEQPLRVERLKAERQLAEARARSDSLKSFLHIEIAAHGADAAAAESWRGEIAREQAAIAREQARVEELRSRWEAVRNQPFTVTESAAGETKTLEISLADAEAKVARAEQERQGLVREFDRFLGLVSAKRWRIGDSLRKLPLLDGLASPFRIRQFTLDELPLDTGGFKPVARLDRCTTCHLGIEDARLSREVLSGLAGCDRPELRDGLENVAQFLQERGRVDPRGTPAVSVQELAPTAVALTSAQIGMFAGHPRLDLFVGSESPHPAERFGCTICHGGQGSATTFVDAAHAPNDSVARASWSREQGWALSHFWNYPMLPGRFLEASCLKCHAQVLDLVREGNRAEAPKLVRGYRLVRDLGCFGCHDIQGFPAGHATGPDLRLEPDPAPESISGETAPGRPDERQSPVGTMRKVGPSLARIADKVGESWTRQWIRSPRAIRPDTLMPHFYDQVNNQADYLPAGQAPFPEVEIAAMAYYLHAVSRELLEHSTRQALDAPGGTQAERDMIPKWTARLNEPGLAARERREIAEQLRQAKTRLRARAIPRTGSTPPRENVPAEETTAKLERGRQLFSVRGCTACHRHDGLNPPGGTNPSPMEPASSGDPPLGPDLTQVGAKLASRPGAAAERRDWLTRWILDPQAQSPRTPMPAVLHGSEPKLAASDADAIAAWLLDVKSVEPSSLTSPAKPALKALARVWLDKTLTRKQLENVLDQENGFSDEMLAMRPFDADEAILAGPLDERKLKMYVGKKAIGHLGCAGCHEIPGLEAAKPIGPALADWGRKDPARLAFEDSANFIKQHFELVDRRRPPTAAEQDQASNHAEPLKEWQGPRSYERFHLTALEQHQRSGFLHLKLQEPRSFDSNREREWNARLRMPQFRFSRLQPLAGESDADFQKRASQDEAEAREAVMTFVLGLTTETLPAKYLPAPAADRQAQIRGRIVLEKYRCQACHVLEPAVYDLVLSPEKFREEERDGKKTAVSLREEVLSRLESIASAAIRPDEYRFPEHSAWTGPASTRPDRLRAQGLLRPEGAFTNEDGDQFGPAEPFFRMNLSQALAFTNLAGARRDLPAGTDLFLPRAAVSAPISAAYGGAFADRLFRMLPAIDAPKYGGVANESQAFAAGPPALVGEGDKVQPAWLYQYLRNPRKLRPLAVLNMPRFPLSETETRDLVNGFAAVSRLRNPGIGLTYPFLAIPETDPGYLASRTAEYRERLRQAGKLDARREAMIPIWKQLTQERLAELEPRVQAAKAQLEAVPAGGPNLEAARNAVASLEAERQRSRSQIESQQFPELQARWLEREIYLHDAFRLVSDAQLCFQCHEIGTMTPQVQQGPSLNLSAERLRPDWLRRWMINPQRFLHYKTIMPINFKAGAREHEALFVGSEQAFSEDQIKACRDLLMALPQVADWPSVRRSRPTPGQTGGH